MWYITWWCEGINKVYKGVVCYVALMSMQRWEDVALVQGEAIKEMS